MIYLAALLAAAICPYINTATVEGTLGGKVNLSAGDAVCEFAALSPDIPSLRIEVKLMRDIRVEFPPFLAQCPNGAPVRGIGNEAVACTIEKGALTQEQILSRVRERSVLVRVSTADKHASRDALREQTRKIAEQVTGFLF